MEKKKLNAYKIAFIGVMAAIVCVVTFFRFPLLNSKVHFANAMCLLSGMLFGGVGGGLAAGLGSALYDALFGGYGVIDCIVTFVSKFAMAFVCAAIVCRPGKESKLRTVIGSVAGALSYVALYMLKTFIYQKFFYGYPGETVWATMLSKLPASLINAVFAMIAAPVLFAALKPVLKKTGLLDKLR